MRWRSLLQASLRSRWPQFTLEIGQTAKIDAHLSVGASKTTVTVNGALAPILDAADGSLGLSLSSNEFSTIPLNGRNFSSVTLFQPDAVATDPTGLTSNNAIQPSTFNSGVVTINGNRAQANNYTLDGTDINETQNNLIGYNVAPDAIQELRVVQANAPTTYGNVNGGDVVTILRSGTNTFHGSLYENIENQNLTANTWANNFSGVRQNPFTQSIFGGTIGGPILQEQAVFSPTMKACGDIREAKAQPAFFQLRCAKATSPLLGLFVTGAALRHAEWVRALRKQPRSTNSPARAKIGSPSADGSTSPMRASE